MPSSREDIIPAVLLTSGKSSIEPSSGDGEKDSATCYADPCVERRASETIRLGGALEGPVEGVRVVFHELCASERRGVDEFTGRDPKELGFEGGLEFGARFGDQQDWINTVLA